MNGLRNVLIYNNNGEYTAVYMLNMVSTGLFAARGISACEDTSSYLNVIPGDHLGKRIKFDQLPTQYQKLILHDLVNEEDICVNK